VWGITWVESAEEEKWGQKGRKYRMVDTSAKWGIFIIRAPCWENAREGDSLKDRGIDGWITLKFIFKDVGWDKWQILTNTVMHRRVP
jgi:hypothetical protein